MSNKKTTLPHRHIEPSGISGASKYDDFIMEVPKSVRRAMLSRRWIPEEISLKECRNKKDVMRLCNKFHDWLLEEVKETCPIYGDKKPYIRWKKLQGFGLGTLNELRDFIGLDKYSAIKIRKTRKLFGYAVSVETYEAAKKMARENSIK